MTLDQQIETLIREAPQDEATPALVRAIAPVLQTFAEQLHQLEYYVAQNIDQQWLSTTLQQQSQTGDSITKTVVYAHANLKDATVAYRGLKDPSLMALPIPVIDLLFRLFSMEGVDSMIFFNAGGKIHEGIEVSRSVLRASVQTYIQSQTSPASPPADIA